MLFRSPREVGSGSCMYVTPLSLLFSLSHLPDHPEYQDGNVNQRTHSRVYLLRKILLTQSGVVGHHKPHHESFTGQASQKHGQLCRPGANSLNLSDNSAPVSLLPSSPFPQSLSLLPSLPFPLSLSLPCSVFTVSWD